MTPSEELELWIYEYAEMTGPAKWRDAQVLPVSTGKHQSPLVFVDAFRDLHARGFIELRRWKGNELVLFDAPDAEFFDYGFQVRVTFSGRKYFEALEARRGRVLVEESTATSHTAAARNPGQPRAFVSHSTQDRDFVKRFATDLREHGVDAWYSEWEIRPGDSIRAKIDSGLEASQYFVIVLSKSSITRPWVQSELDAATIAKIAGRVRKIIPIKIEDCGELPPILGSLCWEDFSSQPYESALRRVLDSIFDRDVRPPLGTPQAGSSKLPVPQQRAKSSQTKFPISTFTAGTFAEQLSGEGFEARTDIFNGQVGLTVGPGGLDLKRLPPDEVGFFLPLWELNHVSNRAFVVDRRFNDLVENRPPDWNYKRPYQQGGGVAEPTTRHWSRSASLLGNKSLEERVQRELISRFPSSSFPVNIDVVGGHHTYAVVQINDFDGINEMERAIPEEYLDRGGMLAAVIAVTERVLSELLDSGRLDVS